MFSSLPTFSFFSFNFFTFKVKFALTPSIVWSFSYFFTTFYVFLVFFVVLYTVANANDFLNSDRFKSSNSFFYKPGHDFNWLLASPLFLFIVTTSVWTGPTVFAWFGHIVFSTFQVKISYLVTFFFLLMWLSYTTTFYFSSLELYDYTIVSYNLFLWIALLFTANNIFTFIFFIEVLSTLVLLVLITSTFSTTYFYNNLSLSSTNYFQKNKPFALLQTLMFIFWISLVASLNLFVYLTLFYMKVVTFDWFLAEHIFHYLWSVSDLKTLFYLGLNWFNLMFCLFLKCGLAPFYFWKPKFFKGIPLHALYTYIFFFYFFLFLFLVYFLMAYLGDVFLFNRFINLTMLAAGVLTLFFILYESYYLKAFFAISSILNSLLVFLAITNTTVYDTILFL